ncbi:MAG: kynB 2 [Chlorobi bacterium]|nr:kynB 2 [Chlorobiota bacterium]
MIFAFNIAGSEYRFDSARPIDISIPLDFHGDQPNAFHLPAASAVVAEGGDFIGDTRRGGSCNCETITMNPHGNGTHTECAGHISHERIAVADVLQRALLPAALVTVSPSAADPVAPAERSVSADDLTAAIGRLGDLPAEFLHALIIRTIPNDAGKRSAAYSGENPPYISREAMRRIRGLGVEHLLIDLPSVDREDEPNLTNHRIFWGMESVVPGAPEPRPPGTITEMIYVDDAVADGIYLLDLQIPAMLLDAAPSRPLLFALEH